MRRSLSTCVALTLALGAMGALAACGKKDNISNPIAPMWLKRPSWALQLTFRRPLVAEQGMSARAGIEKGVPAIDPRHGRLFVGTSDHGMYALRASDGSTIWRFETAATVQSEPLYDDERDVVYFGSDDDGMYCARARDGAMVFRYRTGAEVQRRPILAKRPSGKGILVFVNAADSVFAVDAETGQPRWKRVRTPALGLEISGHAGVAIDGDRVYAAFSTGRVAAYDLTTGTDRWPEVDLAATGNVGSEEQQKYFDVDTTPLVEGDRVYVASVAAGVVALDATSGGPVWRRPEAEGVSWLSRWHEAKSIDPVTQAEIPERTLIIAGSGTTGLWALDPKTGDVRWRMQVPQGAISFPVEIAGALLVTTSKVGMFLLDAKLGHVIDGIDPGAGFAGGAAAFGNRAFVLTNSGVLLGLQVVAPVATPGNTKSW
jgi:outer membrane protein assembly factor BamB